jgi:hypothetical protein
MEGTDFLTRIVNDYHLGNHLDVLDGYQDYRQSGVFRKDPISHFQITIFANKAMIFAMRNSEEQVGAYQFLFADQMILLELFLRFYAATMIPNTTEEAEGLLTELPNEPNNTSLTPPEFAELQNVFKNALSFHVGNFSGMSKGNPAYKELAFDYNGLVFLAFEKNNQFGEADRLLDDLRLVNDEHILVGFLGVRQDLRKRHVEGALGKVGELREKFGDSLRLGSLRAACLLGLQRFEEVD